MAFSRLPTLKRRGLERLEARAPLHLRLSIVAAVASLKFDIAKSLKTSVLPKGYVDRAKIAEDGLGRGGSSCRAITCRVRGHDLFAIFVLGLAGGGGVR
jgi:hypothetical protein